MGRFQILGWDNCLQEWQWNEVVHHKVHLNRAPFFVNNLYCGIGVFLSFHSVTPWFHYQLLLENMLPPCGDQQRQDHASFVFINRPILSILIAAIFILSQGQAGYTLYSGQNLVPVILSNFVSYSSLSLTMTPSLSAWTQHYNDLTPLRNLCKPQFVFVMVFCSAVGTAVLHKPQTYYEFQWDLSMQLLESGISAFKYSN